MGRLKYLDKMRRRMEFNSAIPPRAFLSDFDIEQYELKKRVGALESFLKDKFNYPFYQRHKSFLDYKKKVKEVTESQNIELLGDLTKRSFRGWNIDHIVPILFGYQNMIPPEVIGNIQNLQLISFKENSLKGQGCFCIIEYCSHIKKFAQK